MKVGDRVRLEDGRTGKVVGTSSGWYPEIYYVLLDGSNASEWVTDRDNPNETALKGDYKFKVAHKEIFIFR